MRLFRLLDDVHVPGRWHLGDIPTDAGTTSRFLSGLSFQGQLRAELTRDGVELDFCLTSFAVPVASTRVAACVAAIARHDVQRLPVQIEGHPGFEVLNVVRVIACVDEKRSELTKWTDRDHRPDLAGKYRMVTRLRVDPAAVPNDAHVFRIEGWETAIIVTEVVMLAMAGCIGAKFEEVT